MLRRELNAAVVTLFVLAWSGCGSSGGGPVGSGGATGTGAATGSGGGGGSSQACQLANSFCAQWCCACALCTSLTVSDGDCLDSGGSTCLARCDAMAAAADATCGAAMNDYLDDLAAVKADPDNWEQCKRVVDRDNPFDVGQCPEIGL